MRRVYSLLRVGIGLALAMGLMASSAHALVQHPNTVYPNSEDPPPTLGPDSSVVGWWSYNGSAVAIGPNYILTTAHQGGGATEQTKVNFGGVDYKVVEVFQHSKADIRIARIVNWTTGADATLTNVGYYKNTDEQTKTAVIGGFGYGRLSSTVYPPNYYNWDVTNNKTERWGQNYIESTGSITDPSSFSTQLVWALFDNYGTPNWRPYEASVALYDSGGGWFLRQNGTTGPWQVAGLSRGATTHDAPYSQTSWFNPADGMDCVRVSMYAGWLDAALARSVWNSSSSISTWSEGTKWSNGVPGATDAFAVFSDKVSAGRTVTLTANAQVGTFRFDCPGDLTIDASGSSRLEFGVTNTTTDSGLLEASNANGSGALSIAAPVKMVSPLTVRQNSGTPITISGVISDPNPPSRMLTKTGTGMLVLAGANTYKGGTSIYQGTLRVTNASGLGSTSGSAYVTIVAGATLDLQNDSAMMLVNKVKVILNSSSPALTTATLNADRATPGTPQTMTFSGSLTTDGAVTLRTTSATGCSAAFSGLASITNLGASGVATINTDTADLALTGGLSLGAGTLVKSGLKALTLSGTQSYGSGTALKVKDGTLALNADAGSVSTYNLSLTTLNSAAVTFGSSQHLAALSLTGGSATLAAGGSKVLATKSLSVDPAASRLDISDNHMIVTYTGTSPLPQITRWVQSGYDGGTWLGKGITSSTGATSGYGQLGVGVIDNADPFVGGITQFAGQAVPSSSVLFAYTYLGDANLDGIINTDDYNPIDTFFANYWDGNMETMTAVLPNGPCYQHGDFNMDGVINADDYNLIDTAYANQWGPLSGGVRPLDAVLPTLAGFAGANASGALMTVPEPGAVTLVMAGLATLVARRKTRR